jgi:hypothetical protein
MSLMEGRNAVTGGQRLLEISTSAVVLISVKSHPSAPDKKRAGSEAGTDRGVNGNRGLFAGSCGVNKHGSGKNEASNGKRITRLWAGDGFLGRA